MSGELTKVRGTTKTIVSSGASVSNAAMSAASASSYGTAADGSNYPDAEFVLTLSFGSAPTVGKTIALYAQPLDIDGTADAPAPSTTYLQKHMGSFIVSEATSQSLILSRRDVPLLASYYIYNVDTGQAISAGWTLKVTPVSYKPAP